MDVIGEINKTGIVPVVVIENAEDAVPTARALLAGGINFMEITFRTSCCLEAISEVSKNVPEMIVGAGTVLYKNQCEDAIKAGAKFIVSPGFNSQLVNWCVANGITVCPGCVTPTEIMSALSLGVTTVKFFPANIYGGLKAIKALSAPFTQVKFLPTGGIDAQNMSEYIKEPFIEAVGGSWVCTKMDIKNHEFEKITELSKQAIERIKEARK